MHMREHWTEDLLKNSAGIESQADLREKAGMGKQLS